MAWLKKGHKRYLYRSVRIGGKVRSIYIGTGEKAQAVLEEMRLRREQRQQLRSDRQVESRRLNRIAELSDALDVLLKATFVAGGYYQHKNGPWRPRRGVYVED